MSSDEVLQGSRWHPCQCQEAELGCLVHISHQGEHAQHAGEGHPLSAHGVL
jgi:hypothetical protein